MCIETAVILGELTGLTTSVVFPAKEILIN